MDKPLVFHSKLMGDHRAQQAAAGSAFAALSSFVICTLCGNKLLRYVVLTGRPIKTYDL